MIQSAVFNRIQSINSKENEAKIEDQNLARINALFWLGNYSEKDNLIQFLTNYAEIENLAEILPNCLNLNKPIGNFHEMLKSESIRIKLTKLTSF